MNWKVIKTESQYIKAVRRTLEIFHAAKSSPEAGELEKLLLLLKDYEDRNYRQGLLNIDKNAG